MQRPRNDFTASDEPDVFADLLVEIREMRAALEAAQHAATLTKPGGGNGNGGGWLTKLVAERVMVLLATGFVALAAWIGFSNDRMTGIERDVRYLTERVGALPPQWLVDRVLVLEAWRMDHMTEHP